MALRCSGASWCSTGDGVDGGKQIGQPWVRQHLGLFSTCYDRLVGAFGVEKNPGGDVGSQSLAHMAADDQQRTELGNSGIEISGINRRNTQQRAQVRKLGGEQVAIGTWLVGNEDVYSG